MIKQRGLSLVELMIAVTLGLVLMTGVMQVFLSSKNVYSTQQALSRIQETGRLAIDFLARDIRMAGYMGCASRAATMQTTNTLNTPTSYLYDFNTAIMGYTAATVPLAAGLAPTPKSATDLFVLRGATGNGVQVSENNNSAQLFVTQTTVEAGACADGSTRVSGLCKNDIVMVTDCTKTRVFQATNVTTAASKVNVVHAASGSPGNAITSWGGASRPEDESFKTDSEILLATTTTYFIATRANDSSARPGLWQNVNGTNLELLEGVEDISATYGVDSDKDFVPNDYFEAADVAAADWANVVAVRIEIVVASLEDNVLPETQLYAFAGEENINPDDRRLRQIFTTTVGIRSRSF